MGWWVTFMGWWKSKNKKVSVGQEIATEEVRAVLRDLLKNAELSKKKRQVIEEALKTEYDNTLKAILDKYKISIYKDTKRLGKSYYIVFFGLHDRVGYLKEVDDLGKDTTWGCFYTRSSNHYSIKKYYVRKERIDFDGVYRLLGELQVNIIRLIKNMRRGCETGVTVEWLNDNVLAIVIHEPDGSAYAMYIHISLRKWYCPISVAKEHMRGLKRAANRFEKKSRLDIKAKTYVLIGNYTRNVKGRGVIRKGPSRYKDAYLVFRPDRPWMTYLTRYVYNMFRRRLSRLRDAIEKSGVRAYGKLKEIVSWLDVFVDGFRMMFRDFLHPKSASAR